MKLGHDAGVPSAAVVGLQILVHIGEMDLVDVHSGLDAESELGVGGTDSDYGHHEGQHDFLDTVHSFLI